MFYPWIKLDALSGFISLAILLFSFLTLLYSSCFLRPEHRSFQYYTYIIFTALAALLAVLANHLILLLVAWGVLGLTLYLLIIPGQGESAKVAKKTFILVGGSDVMMLLGIGMIRYLLAGTFQIDKINISLTDGWAHLAYLALAVAAFAKAGAMPLHSWIPEYAQAAPVPVVAYLPASLDKLLGIYLLARLSLNLFVLDSGMQIFLMLVGAITIICAVMVALVQHDLKKLLGYHAVSQVGYMVLGIGTANPIGIAGGLFHMLNHALYKSCLFFTAGNVEFRSKTTDLDKLGGLARFMPLTYISCLVASLAISGVPPLNGFVSKWMVYQGLISQLRATCYVLRVTSIICLVAALFGSALTLASFMKVLHAVFLGQQNNESTKQRINEVPWQMWLPCIILAGLCILFGIFAQSLPLKFFIFPAVKGVVFFGSWYAGLSTFLIICGLIIGWLIFKRRRLKPNFRKDQAFVGGESLAKVNRPSGTEFYNTVKEFGILKRMYLSQEKGNFDLYEQGKNLVFGIGKFLQYLHNGVLPTYLVWTLLGMIVLFFTIFR